FAAFYDYCRKVMSRNLAECFRIQKNRERSANSEILDNFLKGTHLASDCFIAHSFGGFHEAIKHDVERSPGILCSIPVSIEIDTNTITGELVTAGVGVFRHEGNDAKGSFTKIGPFFLKVDFSDQEWECNRPSFVVSGDDGKITISENGKVTPPSHQHCETLIEFAIDYLKNNKKQGLMKRIGRCMGYLQVAAEIEALVSGADKDAVVRETVLRDFNTPPFKTEPDDWIQPGLTYLKGRFGAVI
ncbi:TPA: hypothetical protein ACHJR7_005287, partial [Escherichia coli]